MNPPSFSEQLSTWKAKHMLTPSRAANYLGVKKSDLVRWLTGSSEPTETEKKRILERINKQS